MGNWFLYGFAYFFPDPAIHYNNRDWDPSTLMQFRGEINSPALYSMTDSAAYWNYLGLKDIYKRGVALGNYLKDKIAGKWGKEALWVQKHTNEVFATFLTSFNPFADKNDSAKYDDMLTAVSSVVDTLAEENPKIYIRYTDWRDQPRILPPTALGSGSAPMRFTTTMKKSTTFLIAWWQL